MPKPQMNYGPIQEGTFQQSAPLAAPWAQSEQPRSITGTWPDFSSGSTVDYRAGKSSPMGQPVQGAASGAVQGALTGGPMGALAGGVLGFAGGIVQALFSYYGMQKQIEENKRVEGMRLAQYSREREDLRKDKAVAKRERDRAYKDQKELTNYNKVLNFSASLNSKLRESPQLMNNLINVWNARR